MEKGRMFGTTILGSFIDKFLAFMGDQLSFETQSK